ncbi:MAG TPA: hypothetical protein DCG49_10275 [Ruminococcus sp.]|nr:hypothetical protein [Ruminococcus sp.]
MKNDFLRKRLLDLAAQSDRTGRFTFTDFLNEAELAEFYAIRSELPACGFTISGGYEDAERVMIRFGSEEQLGYLEPFPIRVLHIAPLQEKFGEQLSHRDILGSVMHLGIERSAVGDILIDGKSAYLLCSADLSDYICSALERVKHTSVRCQITDDLPELVGTHTETQSIQIASERLDAVIAKVHRISRGSCTELLHTGHVFINGAAVENGSRLLKEGEKVSVRGKGKFRYLGITGKTKKGNLIAAVDVFV